MNTSAGPDPIHLLIVDDEEDILRILENKTKKYCSQVFLARNGQEALQILEKEKIDCVLCDISMPVMSGVEVIKSARQKKILTPFIFFTGHGSEKLMKEVLKHGAFDFIYKPHFDNLIESMCKGIICHFHRENDQFIEDEFLKDCGQVLSRREEEV